MSKTEKSSSLDSYYRNCPFPKPAKKKKQLLHNGYKKKQERRCYYTGQPGAERHEICGAGGLDNPGDKLVEAALSGNVREQADRIRDKTGSGERVLDGTDREKLSVMIQLEVCERRST